MDADELTGGQGEDIFRYDAVNHFGDTVTDFSVVSDRIDLSRVPGIANSTLILEQSGTSTLVQLLIEGQLQTVATLENVDANILDDSNFIASGISLISSNR